MGLIIYFMVILISAVTGQTGIYGHFSTDHRYLKAHQGKVTYLHPKDIFTRNELIAIKGSQFQSSSPAIMDQRDQLCKVEIINNEPITQLSGQLVPSVFECNFRRGSVRFIHFGSNSMNQEQVHLRVCLFKRISLIAFSSDCKKLTLNFHIIKPIQLSPLVSLVEVKSHLTVDSVYGYSNPINQSIISIKHYHSKSINKQASEEILNDGHDYRRLGRYSLCFVRLDRMNTSPYGRMEPMNVNTHDSHQKLITCDEFFKLNFRYKQTFGAIHEDFVILGFEMSQQTLNDGVPLQEWISIPIVIKEVPKQIPILNIKSNLIINSQITNLAEIMNQVEQSTPTIKLIYNITQLTCNVPYAAHIVHISDPTQPIQSFTHIDVKENRILFKLFTQNHDLSECIISLQCFDHLLNQSPVNSVKLSIMNTSMLSMNHEDVKIKASLFVLEAYSIQLSSLNIQFQNCSIETVPITGGLLHGELSVKDFLPTTQIPCQELINGHVIYSHDGGNATKDYLLFSSGAILPIFIIAIDNMGPVLKLKKDLLYNLAEESSVKITAEYLKGVDLDNTDPLPTILYLVTDQPAFGMIMKKLPWQRKGHQIILFSQEDIDYGLIYYKLMDGSRLKIKNNVSNDSFSFILRDSSSNDSPQKYNFLINIINLIKPIKYHRTSLRMTVEERGTEVITKNIVRFQDGGESTDKEIIYVITKKPNAILGSEATAGKIVFIEWLNDAIDLPSKLGADAFREISRFSQLDINENRIGYQSPNYDIGAYPLAVAIEFTVINKHGVELPYQLLNVTILPINDKPPQIITGLLDVQEGSSVRVSSSELWVYDEDTTQAHIQLALFTVPLHGLLNKNGFSLRVGDRITIDDILSLRLEYVNDGTRFTQDSFTVGCNDGTHYAQGTITIRINLINGNELNWVNNLESKLVVKENGSVVIGANILRSIPKSDAVYLVINENPKFGMITSLNKNISHFNQKDVNNGKIFYTHLLSEVGMVPIFDAFNVSLSTFSNRRTIQSRQIIVEIKPVNSQSPQIIVKEALVVEEGREAELSTDLLSVNDGDSLMTDIIFYLTSPPSFGSLFYQNNTITSFSYNELINKEIVYRQILHKNIEPESDSFKLIASDGRNSGHLNSTECMVPIIIVLRNDEEPIVSAKSVILIAGHSILLDESIIEVMDKDYPGDKIMISLTKPPLHGNLLIMDHNHLTLSKSFTESEISPFYKTVYYKHDGTNNFEDVFSIEVKDGVYLIPNISIPVQILPSNGSNFIGNYGDETLLGLKSNDSDFSNITLDSSIVSSINLTTEMSLQTELVISNESNSNINLILEENQLINETSFDELSTSRYFNEHLDIDLHTRKRHKHRKCAKGSYYYELTNLCYRLVKNRVPWKRARQRCGKYYGGSLVDVISDDLNEWLVNLSRNKSFWIGYNAKLRHRGVWSLLENRRGNLTRFKEKNKKKKRNYISDTELKEFTNWSHGYPKKNIFGALNNKCTLVLGDGTWINKHCSNSFHNYICSQQTGPITENLT